MRKRTNRRWIGWPLAAALVLLPGCTPTADEAETETTETAETAEYGTAEEDPLPADLEREADLRTAEGDEVTLANLDTDLDEQITEDEFNTNYAELAARWDVDGDGTLASDEMSDNFFDLFDGNDDDLIDEEEFQTARKWEAGAEWNNVLDFDKDGDSHLGRTEYGEWFDEQAWDATWDVDGDGVLGPDEQADTFWDLFDLNDDNLIDGTEMEAFS